MGIRGGDGGAVGDYKNGSPVIFEFERAVNETVINKGLSYLDWLMDPQEVRS